MSVTTVNFQFLQNHDPSLLKLAALAERFVFEDPNTALIKIRQLAETLAKSVAAEVGLTCGPDQSILAKAFRGELVPQDPRDEPAWELLTHIRTTRAATAPTKKTRKRKAKHQ